VAMSSCWIRMTGIASTTHRETSPSAPFC